jgi:putative hydrolase of the HAD superfamily
MKKIPDGVRAVFFDAVGTLIHPTPCAADAYHLIGGRYGSRLPLSEVRARFAAAFRAEERFDAQRQHRTDEQRERERWRRIVVAVLDDVRDPPSCFRDLYEHFAQPDAWRCEPGAGDLLMALRSAGFVVGVASNFDHRLRDVVGCLPELLPLDRLAISSEIGWKKPAGEFFAALAAMTGLPAAEILVVGDDLDNDFHGARAAGMRGLLLDPGESHKVAERLGTLGELLQA